MGVSQAPPPPRMTAGGPGRVHGHGRVPAVATWRSPLVAKQKSSLLARRVEQEREPLDGGVAVSSLGRIAAG